MLEIAKAKKVLEENIVDILSVSEWSELMRYGNKKKFTRDFKRYFHENPKRVIIEKQLEYISECIRALPNEKFLNIAWKTGFTDDHALREFIRRHTQESLTKFKQKALSGDTCIKKP